MGQGDHGNADMRAAVVAHRGFRTDNQRLSSTFPNRLHLHTEVPNWWLMPAWLPLCLLYHSTSEQNGLSDLDSHHRCTDSCASALHCVLRYAMLCYAMLRYAMLCYAMLCYAMLCYAMLCYAMLCYILCYAMLSCAKARTVKTTTWSILKRISTKNQLVKIRGWRIKKILQKILDMKFEKWRGMFTKAAKNCFKAMKHRGHVTRFLCIWSAFFLRNTFKFRRIEI